MHRRQQLHLHLACGGRYHGRGVDGGSGIGCSPRPAYESCQVPNGAILEADGGILTPQGGTVTCTDLCHPTEYALTCTGARLNAAPIPDPTAGLNCRILPLPTPENVLFYCCGCAAPAELAVSVH